MFSCEICKIIKKTYFEEHLQATASGCPPLKLRFQKQTMRVQIRQVCNERATFWSTSTENNLDEISIR